ncbi:hypothetical protein PG990_005416 [Apiospora arundinis]
MKLGLRIGADVVIMSPGQSFADSLISHSWGLGRLAVREPWNLIALNNTRYIDSSHPVTRLVCKMTDGQYG